MLRTTRLGPDEVERAHAIVAACGRALAAQGLTNWDPPYPLERMRAEASTREIYLVMADSTPIATYTVSLTPPHAYPHFDLTQPALYLNRLAVAPERWGGGVGAACMREVEARARALGAGFVRCDVFRDNARLRAWYRRLGYLERGPFSVGTVPVVCLERELT
jgi:ribosomal protein S18 acetylase RimI-like enzyme